MKTLIFSLALIVGFSTQVFAVCTIRSSPPTMGDGIIDVYSRCEPGEELRGGGCETSKTPRNHYIANNPSPTISDAWLCRIDLSGLGDVVNVGVTLTAHAVCCK